MGCSDSKEKEDRSADYNEDFDRVDFEVGQMDPNCQMSKLDPKTRIKVKCGGVFIAAAKETQMECLIFYPDYEVTGRGPSGMVCRRLKQRTDLPRWTGVRVQFKEFDSPDDIYKDWYERADRVPGILNNSAASAYGAWVNVNPNVYQSRYILPNGRRMYSPGADEGHYYYSIPQRLHRLWENYATEDTKATLKRLLIRLKNVLPTIRKACTDKGLPDPLEGIDIPDPVALVDALESEMPQFKHYNTVHQISNPQLQDLKEILNEMEDNLLYNWWQCESFADLQIGAFQETLETGEVKQKKSFWDRALAVAVTGADATADAIRAVTHAAIEEKINEVTRRWLYPKDYEPDEQDDLDPESALQLLFPDIDEMVEAATVNLTARASGLTTDELTVLPAEEVEQRLAENRQLDALPRNEKRRQEYDKMNKRAQDAIARIRKMDKMNLGLDGLGDDERDVVRDVARRPHPLKYYFMPYTFFCVFPLFDEGNESATRCPKDATLVIWPAGLSREHKECQRIPMEHLLLDWRKESDEPAAAEVESLFEGAGNSDIDSDSEEDPRSTWVPYPSRTFRGFQATATVTLELTYNFYFELDGENFLDFDSWCKKEGKIQYRRARFETRCGHVTLNPIREMGLII